MRFSEYKSSSEELSSRFLTRFISPQNTVGFREQQELLTQAVLTNPPKCFIRTATAQY
jgi:hypothetical protein